MIVLFEDKHQGVDHFTFEGEWAVLKKNILQAYLYPKINSWPRPLPKKSTHV